MQQKLLWEFNHLPIPDLAPVEQLHRLPGSYINLECRLPNGAVARLLDDDKTYYGAQVEKPSGGRCYGLAADETQLLVYEYGCEGADAELILWKKLR